MKTMGTRARGARNVLVIVVVGVAALGCGKMKPHDIPDAAALADAARDATVADKQPDVAVDAATDVATESPPDVADADTRDADGSVSCGPVTCASSQFCVSSMGGGGDAAVHTECDDDSLCDGGVPTCACFSDLNHLVIPASAICAMGCQQVDPRHFQCMGI